MSGGTLGPILNIRLLTSPATARRKAGTVLRTPSAAIFPTNVAIGFRRVARLQIPAVPLDILSDAERKVAQKDHFCQRPRVIEIGERGWTALAGSDPLGVMTGGARNRFRRRLEVSPLVFGQQFGFALHQQQPSLPAHEQRAVFGKLFVGVEVEQFPRRQLAAVMPGE